MCVAKLLADVISTVNAVEHDVVVLGTRRDAALMQECGLSLTGTYCPPRALPLAGRRGLLRMLKSIEHANGSWALIHGWTPRAAMYASIAMPHLPRICSMHSGLTSKQFGGVGGTAVRAMFQHRATPMLAESQAIKDSIAGIVDTSRMNVLLPGVSECAVDAETRRSVRQRWGVDDDTYVIGAMCEPAGSADARVAVRVIASLRLTGRKVRMVMHHDAMRRADAKWWARRLGYDHLLIVDDLISQPWRVLAGLDGAWIISAASEAAVKPSGCLPLLWAMQSGRPIVAERGGASPEIVQDNATGLLVPPGEIPTILDRFTRLYDEREWAQALSDAARTWVDEHANIAAFAQRIATLYRSHMLQPDT